MGYHFVSRFSSHHKKRNIKAKRGIAPMLNATINPVNSSDFMSQILDSNSFIVVLPNQWYIVLALSVIFLAYLFIKGFPTFWYNKMLKKLEKTLDEKVERINIVRTQVEPKKIEAYTKFSDTFGDMFADPESLMKGIKSGKITQPEMKKLWYDLGAKLFFFASDNTIKKYIELRSHTADQTNFTQGQLTDPMVPIRLYSEIIFSMRKDLGYEDTTCTADDFLKTIM